VNLGYREGYQMAEKSVASLDDLVMQMKITNRLLAAQLRTSMKQNELVRLLSSTGASNAEIADVLNTTAATVKVARYRMKKGE
jgi:DNA-binding CsgD family transcriptional regulator